MDVDETEAYIKCSSKFLSKLKYLCIENSL